MRDETTQVTHSIPGAPRLQSVPATRTRLVPAAKLTRAHLAATQRRTALAALAAAGARVAKKVGPQLKTTLECEASLLPSTLHAFSHLSSRALFFLLDLGGDALAVLELDLLGAGALLARIVGGQEPVSVPTRLSNIEEAAFGWLALTTLAELRAEPDLSAFSPRLVALTLDRGEILREVDARQRYVAAQLKLDIGATPCLARLLVPSLWLQQKLEALPVDAAPALLEPVASAPMTLRCLLGGALLSRADLATLTPGDVVCFPGLSHGETGLNGHGRLIAPSFELRGAFTEAGFTLTRALERPTPEHAMSSNDPTVPVEVEVELTRLRLPLHQLGMVHPGSVLPLHINAAQQVVLRIGDKAVARAELVEIEGELGARIVSML